MLKGSRLVIQHPTQVREKQSLQSKKITWLCGDPSNSPKIDAHQIDGSFGFSSNFQRADSHMRITGISW